MTFGGRKREEIPCTYQDGFSIRFNWLVWKFHAVLKMWIWQIKMKSPLLCWNWLFFLQICGSNAFILKFFREIKHLTDAAYFSTFHFISFSFSFYQTFLSLFCFVSRKCLIDTGQEHLLLDWGCFHTWSLVHLVWSVDELRLICIFPLIWFGFRQAKFQENQNVSTKAMR